jgi:hypothetical protein
VECPAGSTPALQQKEHKAKGSAGIKHILASLTTAHKRILALLARYQGNDGCSSGMNGPQWMEECLAELLVTSDDAFRRYLRELTEQRLVVVNKTQYGQDMYSIPHDLSLFV